MIESDYLFDDVLNVFLVYIEIDEVMKKFLYHGRDLCALVPFLPLCYGKYRWLMATLGGENNVAKSYS